MPKKIVVVEDEPNITEAISFILSRDGWEVSTHANGETAAEAVRAAAPDAVVLDVMLPGRSGYEILQDLRADPEFAALPVLMLTARGQKKDRDLADRLGATRFMTKPFSNAEMLKALREIAGDLD
ncbi:response regulator transcription factor [Maritimibacter fusiformis]|uniref:Response regulator n=1 Tax=Maritimibacter fusiformis TaxID=2603819 RepID=A0A5D0RLI2_9RHOB|nr:response regulator [Maritimibacter fusiformis]TYB82497.1 response regulator [Maritimibacter fusiformis]